MLATLLIIVFITILIYCIVRIWELKQQEKRPTPEPYSPDIAEPGAPVVGLPTEHRNEIWEGIRSKLLSDTPSDWRLAIIEADIYIDRVLDSKGFHGETTSDKFKQVTPDALASIQLAWETHKVRNRIAHEGSAFNLTMPESRRILSYYEIIFRDLGVL